MINFVKAKFLRISHALEQLCNLKFALGAHKCCLDLLKDRHHDGVDTNPSNAWRLLKDEAIKNRNDILLRSYEINEKSHDPWLNDILGFHLQLLCQMIVNIRMKVFYQNVYDIVFELKIISLFDVKSL